MYQPPHPTQLPHCPSTFFLILGSDGWPSLQAYWGIGLALAEDLPLGSIGIFFLIKKFKGLSTMVIVSIW